MVSKGSHFADFVRFRPHNYYSLHAHSTISAALMGHNYESLLLLYFKMPVGWAR